MGFFSGLKNFGSKILGGIKKDACWVVPTLHKVMETLSGPVSIYLIVLTFESKIDNVLRKFHEGINHSNLHIVSTLFTPHKTRLLAEQLTDPLQVLPIIAVSAITELMKDKEFATSLITNALFDAFQFAVNVITKALSVLPNIDHQFAIILVINVGSIFITYSLEQKLDYISSFELKSVDIDQT
ncbi:MAG: hypothetical protein EZS28_014891 [Streblomastix strix]|uniref:Uncharacterized protein n=1 Tax=Streblomastix strix TaxID=222440 RepID=A0A5J4W4C7_9EUKA|nr:MAG: hypothetical protein EZS28_014891 [Streblomastix strix]